MATSTNDIKIRYVLDTSDLKEATQQFDRLSAEEKEVAKEADKLKTKFKEVGEEAKKGADKATKEMSGLEKKIEDIGMMAAGAFAIEGILEFGKAIFSVTSTFESLQTVLSTTLGGNAPALKTMKMIKEVAAATPFSVEELTSSFVKLANQGFRPTSEQIVKLGDLASSTGKSFDMLAEAVIDAQVGEFERLKEFGVRSEKHGEMIAFTFKGVTTEVKNQSEAIQQYLISLGEVEGVAGSMEAQSQTLLGTVSTLGDTWDVFLNTLGTQLYPVFSNALSLTAEFVGKMTNMFTFGKSSREKLMDDEVEAYDEVLENFKGASEQALQNAISNTNKKLIENTKFLRAVNATAKETAKFFGGLETAGTIALEITGGADQLKSSIAQQRGQISALKELLKLKEQARLADQKADALAKSKGKQVDPKKAIMDAYQEELKLAQLEKERQQLQAKINNDKVEEVGAEAEYQERVFQIKTKYLNKGIGLKKQEVDNAKLSAELSAKAYEEAFQKSLIKPKDAISKFQKELTKSDEEEEKKRYDNRLKQMKAWQKEYEKGLEDEKKAREAAEADKQAKVDATFQLTSTLLSGFSNMYQTSISNEIAAMNKRYDNEIVLAEGNEQKIQELNNRRAEEEKMLKQKAFKAEQAAAVAKVIFETAAIVAKWASNPVTAGLAALTLANQAAQIGFIMAQPVPEFAEGTKGKPFKGGRAMVGEKGIEKVVTASGKVYFTPPTATLVDLPAGSQVVPNHALSKQELFWASRMSGGGQASNPMYGKLDELGSILKSLPITQLNMDERGFEKYIRTERRTTKILNNRFRS
jgi:hypothetical protein